MKTLLLTALTVLISTAAFADIPEIRARDVSCQELQDAVRNYGQVTVLTKGFLRTKRLTVSQEINCGIAMVHRLGIFKTKDRNECLAGTFCVAEHVIVVVDHGPRHERWPWRHRHPTPGPIPHPGPDHDHHRIPDHNHPGPHYDPRPDHDRPHHEHHDRPDHDRPHHEHHDRPDHDHGCHGRHCSL